jgi:hypothetical protein
VRAAAVALLALAACAAAAAAVPHRADVVRLYVADHGGRQPLSDAQLQPYSREVEMLLAACTISSVDLTHSASSLARRVSLAGGTRFTSLRMLQAFARRVTWTKRRDCWNTFFDVEEALVRTAALATLSYPRESEALYVYDHIGDAPPRPGDLTPYSNALEAILGACRVSAEDATNLMVHLSDMASAQGGRNVTTLAMLQAIVRRIDWKIGKRICWSVFDDAEGHMEAGGP